MFEYSNGPCEPRIVYITHFCHRFTWLQLIIKYYKRFWFGYPIPNFRIRWNCVCVCVYLNVARCQNCGSLLLFDSNQPTAGNWDYCVYRENFPINTRMRRKAEIDAAGNMKSFAIIMTKTGLAVPFIFCTIHFTTRHRFDPV